VGSLDRASRRNHISVIQSFSQSGSSNRLFTHGGLIERYPIFLRCLSVLAGAYCSQVVTRGWTARMRKPSTETGQISLLHRAIFNIHTMRGRLLDAFTRRSMWAVLVKRTSCLLSLSYIGFFVNRPSCNGLQGEKGRPSFLARGQENFCDLTGEGGRRSQK